jgi:hypothetical protein
MVIERGCDVPKLQITLFWCKDADVEGTRSKKIIEWSRDIAGEHGLQLEFFPHGIREPQFVLDYTGEVITRAENEGGDQTCNNVANKRVRGLVHAAFPTGSGRLPIVFGKLGDISPGRWIGYTAMAHPQRYGHDVTSDWLPWCIVDPFRGEDSAEAILHEAGHAAGAVHSEISAPLNDLMRDGGCTTPVSISAPVLDLLRRAYFYW